MGPKRSKNAYRRAQAKKRKLEATSEPTNDTKQNPVEAISAELAQSDAASSKPSEPLKSLAIDEDELYEQFAGVFKRFKPAETSQAMVVREEPEETPSADDTNDYLEDKQIEEEPTKLLKRQQRKQNRVSLADLKLSTRFPQLVEATDADAPDPYLLVKFKTLPNAVPVPSHWKSRKGFLTRKGIDRMPFKLPQYIADTGIMEMRHDPLELTLKQQQRSRVQVKLGRLDIDYNKLHDAFFKFQFESPPRLYKFGDVYSDTRDESTLSDATIQTFRPGVVNLELRKALGMPENDMSLPPPWISVMRQIGKPPAYAYHLIPGVDGEYNNRGYQERQKKGKLGNYGEKWGVLAMVESLEDEDDDESEDEQEEEEHENGQESNDKNNSKPDTKVNAEPVERVEITSMDAKPIVDSNKSFYTVVNEKKSLTEVLREQTVEHQQSEPKPEKKKPKLDIADFKF